MMPYPNPFTQDPEMSSSRNQEVKSHSTLNPYNFYHSMPSPPLFSPLSFNYDFFFAADALPADASPLPPLDPKAGEEIVTVAAPPAPRKAGAGGCRKRSRSDRHSKIHTSQGLRDRRMRLSLRVARRFFRLQDMLGFDKASHTIDWLLKQSKSAIDLVGPGSSRRNSQPLNSGSFITDSSASECEVASSNSHHKAKPAAAAASSSKAKASAAPRPSREVAFGRSFTRESRQKARARAKERTIEKKRLNSTRGFVDQLATCECSQMNMNSSWFNMYSNEDEGNLPRDQKN